MPDQSNGFRVSIDHRIELIKALPCFRTLTINEARALAELMQEKSYSVSEVLIHEDDFVDAVYIIVSGRAEVTQNYTQNKGRVIAVPVAILRRGESIGLSANGFFSLTGQRTATVTALTPLNVLVLPLSALETFFKEHPHIRLPVVNKTTEFLRLLLIKQSLPFSKLSFERINWLAGKIEELKIKKGEVIFNQGEVGHCCYLIKSGEVEITAFEKNNRRRHLATLKTPTLFGEATLVTQSQRNANAVAKTDCELLVLEHKYLTELIESEKNVASMVMSLMVNRSRPMACPNIIAHHQISKDNQKITILKNCQNNSYFKLSEEGWFIWQQLDGKHSMQEVTLALADKYNIFAPAVVASLVSKLAKAGFVDQVYQKLPKPTHSLFMRGILKLRTVLEAHVAFGNVNHTLTIIYNKFIKFLFTRPAQLIMGLVAICGFISFFLNALPTLFTIKFLPHAWWVLIALIPFALISACFHELGHAFATKAMGYEVHYIGFGWYWFTPVAFTDTSDMWLSTRGPRTVVNLAGIFSDLVLAGAASLLIWIISNPYLQAFFWVYALYSYISAFRMLSPLQELDGYYVLMDWVNRPHLRQAAVQWLMKGFPAALRKPGLFKEHIPEIIYWCACIVFLILITLLILWLQEYIFKILNIHSQNMFVSLAVPIFGAFLSSLGVLADLRAEADE